MVASPDKAGEPYHHILWTTTCGRVSLMQLPRPATMALHSSSNDTPIISISNEDIAADIIRLQGEEVIRLRKELENAQVISLFICWRVSMDVSLHGIRNSILPLSTSFVPLMIICQRCRMVFISAVCSYPFSKELSSIFSMITLLRPTLWKIWERTCGVFVGSSVPSNHCLIQFQWPRIISLMSIANPRQSQAQIGMTSCW